MNLKQLKLFCEKWGVSAEEVEEALGVFNSWLKSQGLSHSDEGKLEYIGCSMLSNEYRSMSLELKDIVLYMLDEYGCQMATPSFRDGANESS